MAELDRLIAEAKMWRAYYKDRLSNIEAAACSIRLKALLDAKAALAKVDGK